MHVAMIPLLILLYIPLLNLHFKAPGVMKYDFYPSVEQRVCQKNLPQDLWPFCYKIQSVGLPSLASGRSALPLRAEKVSGTGKKLPHDLRQGGML